MKRFDWRLITAVVLCLITITVGFGGDYIKQALDRTETINQASAAPVSLTTTATGTASTAAPPAARAEPQRRDEDSITVYITDTGERYHGGSCQHLRRSKHPVSLASAKRQGYTPCKVCRPAR